MKTLRFKIIICLLSVLSFEGIGQVKKGNSILGLNLTYRTNSASFSEDARTNKYHYLNTGVNGGIMVTNNFLLSVGFFFKDEFNDNIYSSANSYSNNRINALGVSISGQYFKNLKSKFYYTPIGTISYEKGNVTNKVKNPGFAEVIGKTKSNEYFLTIQPVQFSYLLNNKFLLSAGFGAIQYRKANSNSTNPGSPSSSNGDGFNFDFTPSISNIGISIKL